MKRRIALLTALAALTASPYSFGETAFPQKGVTFIVPLAAGGGTDILARKLAQKLGEQLGRQVIVDNKAGAGGTIGTEATVRADADGTTILLHSGAISTEPGIKAKLPYDVTKDLAAVTTVVRA